MGYQLSFLAEVAQDFAQLPTEALKVIARDLLYQIRDGVEVGRTLEDRIDTGDLGGCRKVYFDSMPGPPGYRIVFRYLDDGVVEVVEIVAIGPRDGLAVYKPAADRLGRSRRK